MRLPLPRIRLPRLPWPLRRKRSGPEAKREAFRLLSGYVLHMSITSLGDGDITPLFEEYLGDPRLGPFERQELLAAFRTLRAKSHAAPPDPWGARSSARARARSL